MFLRRYKERGTIARKKASGLPPKLSTAALEVIDTAIKEDDDLTATHLQSRFAANGIYVSLDQNDSVIDEAILPCESSWAKLDNARKAR